MPCVSGDDLAKLRRRLTISYALITLVVLGVLAAIAVTLEHDRRYESLDDSVETSVLEAAGYAYPQGDPSKLVVEQQPAGYFGPAPAPDRRAGRRRGHRRADRGGPEDLLDADAARRVRDRSLRRQTNAVRLVTETVDGTELRIADAAIFGTQGQIGAVVAAFPTADAASETRSTAIKIGLGTLGLWLLTVVAGWFLAGRALAPAAAMAVREEAFLADAAHELRTPVAVIRARAEQGLREGADGEAGKALGAIAAAAERATVTIADMLELARLDARHGRFEREPMRLDFLVEQIADEYEETAQDGGRRDQARRHRGGGDRRRRAAAHPGDRQPGRERDPLRGGRGRDRAVARARR